MLFRSMKMTGPNADYDYGTGSCNKMVIQDASHPLAAGLSGTVTLSSWNTTMTWGKPSTQAIKVGTFPGYNWAFLTFGYETGSSMYGLPAPARRVGLFLNDDTCGQLSADAKKLVGAAIDWAFGDCSGNGDVTPPAACNQNGLLVVGSLNLDAGDQAVLNRLQSLGYNMTVRDDNAVVTADADGKGLIVISSTVNSGYIGSKFTQTTVPVLNFEPWLYDDLKMTGQSENWHYGMVSNKNKVKILDSSHPIAGGLSWTQTVYSYYRDMSWGVPSNAAAKIAEVYGCPGSYAVFAYDKGDYMVGMNAPGRRVGFFLNNGTATKLTSIGWQLFDNAVVWATGCSAVQGRASSLELLASVDGPHARLNWITEREEATDFFVVEKSTDGNDFQPVTEVAAAGMSEAVLSYEALDLAPEKGVNYYRVKLVYFDGSYAYTQTAALEFGGFDPFQVYPNPATEYVTVDVSKYEGKAVTIRILDQVGQLVMEQQIDRAAQEPVRMDLGGFLNGYYAIHLEAPGELSVVKKLVVSRMY